MKITMWPDGTPRSMGGPFDVLYCRLSEPAKAMTADQARRDKERLASQAYRAAKRAAKDAEYASSLAIQHRGRPRKAKVLRDNVGNTFCPPLRIQAGP